MPPVTTLHVLQAIVGLTLLNVWVTRSSRPTAYRGGDAPTLREEFRVYGLPDFMFYLVGGLKIVAGLVLLAGLWWALPVRVAAGVVAALMVGAIAMHIKVKDPVRRSVPAALMLAMCVAIAVLSPS